MAESSPAATSPAPASQIKFPYLFLLLSLAALILVYVLLTRSVSSALGSAILEATQASNATVTKVFVNELYPRLQQDLGFSGNAQQAKRELSAEELQRVDGLVRQFMLGTDILKAKLYNINGLLVYSSVASELGQDKSENPGFISAARGKPASEVSYRDKFVAFGGEVFQRDLVSSYIPVRDGSGDVVGVAELYTDRSQLVEFAKGLDLDIKVLLIPLLALILLLIALLVWRFNLYVTQVRIALLQQDLPPGHK
ncbi:MAG: hypothetical protein HQL47_06840 [Gammaproteobacteria bacterium]|nr:hypothetical protein [Gammaproteobacteria bacterium]